MNRLRGSLAAFGLASALLAGTAAPAVASTLAVAKGRAAITNHAYNLTIQTSADHFNVSGCFRRSSSRVNCKVTVYGIEANSALVDCTFYSSAFYVGRSRHIHLGDTTPVCRAAEG